MYPTVTQLETRRRIVREEARLLRVGPRRARPQPLKPLLGLRVRLGV